MENRIEEIKWQIENTISNHNIGFITSDEMIEQIETQLQELKQMVNIVEYQDLPF